MRERGDDESGDDERERRQERATTTECEERDRTKYEKVSLSCCFTHELMAHATRSNSFVSQSAGSGCPRPSVDSIIALEEIL